MRVHKPQRYGKIAIGRGLDKRHEMLVPADLECRLERKTLARQRREPIRNRLRTRFVKPPNGREPHREPRAPQNRC